MDKACEIEQFTKEELQMANEQTERPSIDNQTKRNENNEV